MAAQSVQAPALFAYGNRHELERRGFLKIGVDHYISEEFYQKELNTIWRKCWLWAGRAADIPNPGDYFVFNLPFLNRTSILVMRGRDGRIRGFFNACQHRGSRLAYYERGSARVIRCTFHGWTYDPEGKLLGVTCEDSFCDFDRSQRGLKPVSVDTWGGWVFVNLDLNPRWTLQEYLSPLPKALGQYFEKEPWTWARGLKGVFKCNWKLPIDSQAEGYHAAFLHGRSSWLDAKFKNEDMPAWIYPDSPGVPYKQEVHIPEAKEGEDSGVFLSELAKLVGRYRTATYNNTDSDAYRDDPEAAKYPGAVNVSNARRWTFDIYGIFPNTVFIIQKGHLLAWRSWPRGVGETLLERDYYFTRQPGCFGEYLARLHSLLENRNTITEDMVTVEGMYNSYLSGAVNELIIGEVETGVGAFERHVLGMVDELSDDSNGGSRPSFSL
jgi:phenylpropionate dioxygenase-like ring-hydroxylating dioxygenase large terminal subunit